MAKRLNILFGALRLGNAGWAGVKAEDATDEVAAQVFKILKKNNVKFLDTARSYGNSEEALGRLKVGTEHDFLVDTKWLGGAQDPTSTTKERIISDAKDSLAKLGVSKVHTFYLHTAFTGRVIEDALLGINEAYKLGMFENFGLSNFSPSQVQEVYDVCKRNGFVLPTVFQGLYNPVNRTPEEELFPLLRKLGIAFNAYSPVAGGFLTKTREHVVNGEGRFEKGNFAGLYAEMYNNEPYLVAQEKWAMIAEEEGVTPGVMANRWVVYNSSLKEEFGDGIILGGRLSQLEETFEALDEGKLTEGATRKIQAMWDKLQPHVKHANNLDAIVGAAKRAA